ncbi:MAG: COR domain-containing protein [Anaerolineales bacterium]
MAQDLAYYAAVAKIEAVQHSGDTSLDLGAEYNASIQSKLSEIPESLAYLAGQLRALNLFNNRLTALPEWLGEFKHLQTLNISGNNLTILPASLGDITYLKDLNISNNHLATLPNGFEKLKYLETLNLANNPLMAHSESISIISKLTQLKHLDISGNQLQALPNGFLDSFPYLQFVDLSRNQLISLSVGKENLNNLKCLLSLNLSDNQLATLPGMIGNLLQLQSLDVSNNRLTDLPVSIARLEHLQTINLSYNVHLDSELAVACKQGIEAIRVYLRAQENSVVLNEAKLILIGEGAVGKSCLLGALRDEPWNDSGITTHGIEIKPIKMINPITRKELVLNGWDFGGQRVYRPTHQLFFSAPAVYLVVWKPREGSQQGFVREWIKLVKHREPDAKILVVATHGWPGGRQPDIDRQELWDLFGQNTIVDFFFVDSKPDEKGQRRGIAELKDAIARVASELPEMGRSIPKSFKDVRQDLQKRIEPYLSLNKVLAICREYQMDDETADLFITISHRLGHLTHYQHDPALRDIVILRPDWLATAISYALDDEATRNAHGLVRFSRLSHLWKGSTRPTDTHYPEQLHRIFLRLMERFDLSYHVTDSSPQNDVDPQVLIAQLVPDNRPERDLERKWTAYPCTAGNLQQMQICRIVDDKGNSALAEGLFYQLIVRLNKYSLGRSNYNDSVHWQRGLVLDDDYNGRALLEHIGNDVRITVRAPYPERFLAMLTGEVKYLIESFWEGLRCDVMVPCVEPCGRNAPGTGLYNVRSLIESKREGQPKFPCPNCNKWQDIDTLLRNAPTAQPDITTLIFAEFSEVKTELLKVRQQLTLQNEKTVGRFDHLDDQSRRILSRVDNAYSGLMQAFTDEAREGPRLFSLVPVDRSKFNPLEWTSAKFRIILWCEHSRLPLPLLNGNSQQGVYEFEFTRDWFKQIAPYLKVLSSTLSLVLPVASSGIDLALDNSTYTSLEKYLDYGKEAIDGTLGENQKIGNWLNGDNLSGVEKMMRRAQGATLRELHTLLKSKDAGFGGLVRVMNKRQEFLWVHKRFVGEY